MSTSGRPRRLLSVLAAASVPVLLTGALVGCQARPGDAPTVAAPQTDDSATETAEPQGTAAEELRTVTVGVDSLPTDFNPHLVGSQSLATSVIAQLTLPSAFTAPTDGDGRRTELNSDLLASVTVVEGTEIAPTKVRYVLRPTAQWSDGTPVTGADFSYLWEQITTRPGVLDPAGYANIDDLAVSAGARTVDVTFAEPDPDWRELFADLLPSHIYRSEDRSFATMMSGVPAASGGVYRVRAVDTARGTVELERNERFWGENPAQADRLVLSVVPDESTASQMLRTGQLQMLLTGESAVTTESLGSVPGTQVRTMTRRPDLVLTLNTTAPRMATVENRDEVIDALDTTALARILTGDPTATPPETGAGVDDTDGTTVNSSQTGRTEPGQTRAELTNAPDLPAVDSGLTPLRIGADSSDDTAVEAARRIVDQLEDAGISAETVTRSAEDLYGSFLPQGEVDAVVAWQEAPETLSDLADRYSCDSADRELTRPSATLPSVTAASTSASVPATSEAASPSASASTTAEPTEPGESGDSGTVSGRTVNISGLCDTAVDEIVDTARLTAGQVAGEDALAIVVDTAVAQVDALVTGYRVDVPLISDRQVIAVGGDLVGPEPQLADWPLDRETGPFISAGQWRRTGDTTTSAAPTTTEEKTP
ncbi:ABC transporter family substrate-binding protein [Corynebacterium terpenotabidum]|uniref:Solute-binding protein family 5 domain-containing protein n=1 Tax=Corynebacterium terpenotabidum Y-11 TaxID=1200352 RepID=S4XF25_9CORY|nr:ABC transporter family substrate-binding protein [Corynebacterium terpenotabidum]AGP31174.1 hypothetical protein A606_07635 [Corynebacterium terpenotabidum Y-11]